MKTNICIECYIMHAMCSHITVTSSNGVGWSRAHPDMPNLTDPSDFTSSFGEVVRFTGDHEVAITKIMYGPLFNIDSTNSRFRLRKGSMKQDLHIPPGHYESTIQLLGSINTVLKAHTNWGASIIKKHPTLVYSKVTDECSLMLNDEDLSFLIDDSTNAYSENVLKYLGYGANGETNIINVKNNALPLNNKVGMIFSDIVGDSIIDGDRKNLLDSFPLSCSVNGYCCYEFINPTYHPLRVNAFTKLSIKISDIYGNNINIQDKVEGAEGYAYDKYPTIITLHVRLVK